MGERLRAVPGAPQGKPLRWVLALSLRQVISAPPNDRQVRRFLIGVVVAPVVVVIIDDLDYHHGLLGRQRQQPQIGIDPITQSGQASQ
jgi:hypothetical protein